MHAIAQTRRFCDRDMKHEKEIQTEIGLCTVQRESQNRLSNLSDMKSIRASCTDRFVHFLARCFAPRVYALGPLVRSDESFFVLR